MGDPEKKKIKKQKDKKNVFFQKVKQFVPGKGRLLKKLLFDVEGEVGTDDRRPLKIK